LMGSVDELGVLNRARQGDRQAFEEILRPVVQPAYRLALAMLHEREAAEDAVQEMALKAWHHRARIRPELGTARPWFLAIVANQCRTAARGRWWSVIRLDATPSPAGSGFEDRIVRGADLRAALRKLAVDQREVLVLRYYLDLPLEEVAAIIGVPVGTVKSRINRGLAALRPHFEAVEAVT